MSNSDYSRLLSKMNELKGLTQQYTTLTTTYMPATTSVAATAAAPSNYQITLDRNAISKTSTPLVTRPGEDFGRDWKYIGKVTPNYASNSNTKENNSLLCRD